MYKERCTHSTWQEFAETVMVGWAERGPIYPSVFEHGRMGLFALEVSLLNFQAGCSSFRSLQDGRFAMDLLGIFTASGLVLACVRI